MDPNQPTPTNQPTNKPKQINSIITNAQLESRIASGDILRQRHLEHCLYSVTDNRDQTRVYGVQKLTSDTGWEILHRVGGYYNDIDNSWQLELEPDGQNEFTLTIPTLDEVILYRASEQGNAIFNDNLESLDDEFVVNFRANHPFKSLRSREAFGNRMQEFTSRGDTFYEILGLYSPQSSDSGLSENRYRTSCVGDANLVLSAMLYSARVPFESQQLNERATLNHIVTLADFLTTRINAVESKK